MLGQCLLDTTVLSPDQILRPKWTELYHARKKQSAAAERLPELPKSFFGWILVVYSIPEEELLASAGLDAYAVGFFVRIFPQDSLAYLVSFCPSSHMRSNTCPSRSSSLWSSS